MCEKYMRNWGGGSFCELYKAASFIEAESYTVGKIRNWFSVRWECAFDRLA